MRPAGINRQFMANVGDRLAGRSILSEPRRNSSTPCRGAQLPGGDHVPPSPPGSFFPPRPIPVAAVAGAGKPLPPAPADSVADVRAAASRPGCAGASDGRAAVAASAAPAEITVPLPDQVMLMLRLAAAAAGVSVGEAVQRAICRYADSLGLQQVLADAVALDPDLAVQFSHARMGASRFKGGP